MAIKPIPLEELKVGDLIAATRDGKQTVEVLEIVRNTEVVGEGKASDYASIPTPEAMPISWSGLRSSGSGYTDTKVLVDR